MAAEAIGQSSQWHNIPRRYAVQYAALLYFGYYWGYVQDTTWEKKGINRLARLSYFDCKDPWTIVNFLFRLALPFWV